MGTDDHLNSREMATDAKNRVKPHTTLYSVVSSFLRKLVAPQPLPRTTRVFFVGSWGSCAPGVRS